MKTETVSPNHIAAAAFFPKDEPRCTFNRWAWIPIGMILVVLIELMRAI